MRPRDQMRFWRKVAGEAPELSDRGGLEINMGKIRAED
jgi:hypothetical protein